MPDPTRRAFLQSTLAAGGGLAAGGLADRLFGGETAAPGAPLIVVTQTRAADVQPRSTAWCYIAEILRQAGVFFEQLPPDQLPLLAQRKKAVVVLAGHLPLSTAQRDVLAAWVKAGGALVGIGGTSGLDDVFGVAGACPFSAGWIKVTAADHPVTAGLRSALHVFGGQALKPGTGTSLAEVDSTNRYARGSAIVEHRFGQGRAVLLGPDLMFSIVHIQQGVPVFQDVSPAPDESALTNDGVLKAEDGLVLDWKRDRTPMAPDDVPVFLEPITDELREIILRSVFHVARCQGVGLCLLWYWPRGLKAVGHISHDTDGHDPQKGAALHEVMNRCRVKSTWCVLYPGGYPRELYAALADQGYEIALHYDAMSGGPETSWSKENLVLQHRWLRETAGIKHITSNKNHYTRWEGRLAFFRWCEAVGIQSDQTRGPSKKGSIGYPLGGSQPYFPLDDEAATPRMMDVLEVNMLTQDLVVVCPADYGRPLLDSALRHYGVAHFLFHPAHIQKPHVADTLCGLADLGREQGMEWWTNEQIYRWEIDRRGVRATFDAAGMTLQAARPLKQATLLVLRTGLDAKPVHLNGQAAAGKPWNVYGFDFDSVTTDLSNSMHLRFT